MLSKIWNGESKTITSAALILGGASLASRLLGVIRDRVLAGRFGAGDVLDAYYAAFRLPDAVYSLLVIGALSAGFIPVFTEYLMRDGNRAQQDAWRLVNEVIGWLGAALAAFSLLLILFAPMVVPLITPGFHGVKLADTVMLSRIMFLSPLILGLSAIFGSVLQGMKRFLAFAVAPLFYNLGIIVGALVFTRWWGISGLAWGVVFGALLHLLAQYFTVAGMGFRLQPRLKLADDGVPTVARLSLPRVAALAVSQIDLTVATLIASTLTAGSIAVFNLANNLQMVPVVLVGTSFAVAAFPTFTRLAAKKEHAKLAENVNGVTRQILFFVVPFSVLLLLLRAQFVRVILGSGNFSWSDTIRTADTLAFFTISIFAQSVVPLLSRAFYALKDSTTPLLVGLISVGVDVIGNITLSGPLGVRGLALAFTLASVVQVTFLWVTLRMKTGTLYESLLIRSLMKITVSAVPMALVMQLTKNFIGPRLDLQTFVGIFMQGVLAGVVGLSVYFGIALLVRSEEASGFYRNVKRRIGMEQLPVVAADEAIE